MKNLYRKFSIFFSIMILVPILFPLDVQAFRAPAAGLTSGISSTMFKPVFSSSFIQYWYSQDWDQARWEKELTMLKDIGVDEVILQNIADTKDKYTVYPTAISGYTSNDVDMVGTVLNAADKLDMKVRMGLGFNDDWWSKNASDIEWLDSEASSNKAIIDEISAMYGNHPSLHGWYIPYEFSQFTAITSSSQASLNGFFKQIASAIREKSTYDIMISPFYNGIYLKYSPLQSWSTMVENVVKDTGISVLALQDSVGAGYNTTDQLGDLFSYTKKATDASGIKLYGNIETFTSTSRGNISAPQSRISEQMVKEKPYVRGFIAFSINHYQNKNEEVQLDYYNDYYNYYLQNK